MPRRVGSSSSMISMARTLGAPVRVPAGKQARERVDGGEAFAQRAFHGADQMHHVGIAFDEHEIADLYGAELADAANVIAAKVDEHYVLGTLFFVMTQLVFQRAGLRLHLCRACACRRWDGTPASFR